MVELLTAVPWWGWALTLGVGFMFGFASIALMASYTVRSKRDE